MFSMLIRLFLLLCFLISGFIQVGHSTNLEQLVDGYWREAGVRYPVHTFTIDGSSVENVDQIEGWHNIYAHKLAIFSQNTFGKFEGRNWAFASMSIVYQKTDGNFSVNEPYTFPHIFGSGVTVNVPEPSSEEQLEKQVVANSILGDFSLFFADTGRPGAKTSDRIADFIHEIEPIVIEHLPLFTIEHRSVEKMQDAFAAWRGGSGDKNLCRNWFTDSEQVILSYMRRNINYIFEENLRPSIDGAPLFLLLNIVTLQDMCGICFRSVYIQSKMNAIGLDLLVMPFVTGILPYHGSRDGLTLGDTSIDIPSNLTKGIIVVRNK